MTQGNHMRWMIPLSLLIWTTMPLHAQGVPHVYTGRLSCELKQVVVLQAHPELPGQYQLRFKKKVFNLTPSPGMSGVVRLHVRDVLAAEQDLARARLGLTRQQLEEGALARAVGADDGDHLALAGRQ